MGFDEVNAAASGRSNKRVRVENSEDNETTSTSSGISTKQNGTVVVGEAAGRLEIVIGCMFSGKTSELIRRLSRCRAIGKQCVVINTKKDGRIEADAICTHDRATIPAIKVANLMDEGCRARVALPDVDVIGIDEGQFFGDLIPFVLHCTNQLRKTVIVSGLDGDFQQNVFGDILMLIPHADSVTKLHALCRDCGDGTPASFSKRTINDSAQELVGASECYKAVCRFHLNNDA